MAKPKGTRSGGRANRAGALAKTQKQPQQRLSPQDAVVTPAREVEQPLWEDVRGDTHVEKAEAEAVNMKVVLELIIENDMALEGLGQDHAEEYVERIMRNLDLLKIALAHPGDIEKAFDRYMQSKFKGDWRASEQDEDRAVRAAMRDAFFAGWSR